MSLKTSFEDIVDVCAIGRQDNTRILNELLQAAGSERVKPASEDREPVLVIAVDVQQDFMENGSLGVPGSHTDVENFSRFIYRNLEKITCITASLDTHNPFQIFHPCWWVDEEGNNPPPFTGITLEDLKNGKWSPVVSPSESRRYVQGLADSSRKMLVVWPYHCIQGTVGHALENQFANMVYFHSVARKTVVERLVKGQDQLSEMYGIIKPEYDPGNYINLDFLGVISQYRKVIIGGEAKSHCVLESIRQILEHFSENSRVTPEFYLLEDCMSVIPGFEKETEDCFKEFSRHHRVTVVNSRELNL